MPLMKFTPACLAKKCILKFYRTPEIKCDSLWSMHITIISQKFIISDLILSFWGGNAVYKIYPRRKVHLEILQPPPEFSTKFNEWTFLSSNNFHATHLYWSFLQLMWFEDFFFSINHFNFILLTPKNNHKTNNFHAKYLTKKLEYKCVYIQAFFVATVVWQIFQEIILSYRKNHHNACWQKKLSKHPIWDSPKVSTYQ